MQPMRVFDSAGGPVLSVLDNQPLEQESLWCSTVQIISPPSFAAAYRSCEAVLISQKSLRFST